MWQIYIGVGSRVGTKWWVYMWGWVGWVVVELEL